MKKEYSIKTVDGNKFKVWNPITAEEAMEDGALNKVQNSANFCLRFLKRCNREISKSRVSSPQWVIWMKMSMFALRAQNAL